MGHRTAGARLPSLCLNRIRLERGRARAPPLRFHRKTAEESECEKTEESGVREESGCEKIDGGGGVAGGECAAADEESGHESGKPEVVKRRIMVVVDSSGEAKAALQWALTHTVQNHDTLILLHATKITKQGDKGNGNKKKPPRAYELLHTLKKTCYNKRPEVQVETTTVEGKEKGPAIVEEAKKQGVSMLVLGQKKQAASTTWRLLMMWAGSRVAAASSGGGGVVEYCIQNAECMAVAVRRKSKKLGGYLITTKRHKDFWLLA